MTPLDTVRENLAHLHGDFFRISEKTLYELYELSEIFYNKMEGSLEGEAAEMLLHRGSTESFFLGGLYEGVPVEYESVLREEETLVFASRVCAFSIFLSERLRKGGASPLPWREEKKTRVRVVYVPSGKAEEAYFALASLREDVSVLYATSTQDAVNALLSKAADYAMLPYLSANGERILGVERLCAQNDLYLCARIAVPEREARLVYALFSSENSPDAITDAMALSVQVTADSYAHLGRILSVLPALGYEQIALFTEAEEYGRVRARLELVDGGDALALWIFLSLYSAGSSLLGRYPMIETKER